MLTVGDEQELACGEVGVFHGGLTVARYLSEGCPHDVHTIGAVTTDTSATKVFSTRGFVGPRSVLGTLPNTGGEFLDVIEDLASGGHLVEDFLLRVHDGRVVAPEGLADFGQGEIGEFSAQVHGDLSRLRQRASLPGTT